MKRALFYQAYALYYEKVKKFDEADKMYRLGVQNLVEPIGELHTSYEQFVRLMERHKSKIVKHREGRTSRRLISLHGIPKPCKSDEHNENICSINVGLEDTKQKGSPPQTLIGSVNEDRKGEIRSQNLDLSMESDQMVVSSDAFDVEMSSNPSNNIGYNVNPGFSSVSKQQVKSERDGCKRYFGYDTVVAKFVDTTIVGQPKAEDACHHGLVDPTKNLVAMNAINSMFREPIDSVPINRKLQRNQKEETNKLENGFKVFDESNLNKENPSSLKMQGFQAHHEPLEIFIDANDDARDDKAGESKHARCHEPTFPSVETRTALLEV